MQMAVEILKPLHIWDLVMSKSGNSIENKIIYSFTPEELTALLIKVRKFNTIYDSQKVEKEVNDFLWFNEFRLVQHRTNFTTGLASPLDFQVAVGNS